MDSDLDSDLEPELLGNIAELQRMIDEGHQDESSDECVAVDEDDEIEVERSPIAGALKDIDAADLLAQEAQADIKRCLDLCNVELKNIQKDITMLSINMRAKEKNEYGPSLYGFPYFRDENNCKPPDNSDTTCRRQLGMMNYFLMLAGNAWTAKDKRDLKFQILEMSRQMQISDLDDKLAELKALLVDSDSRDICENRIRKQVTTVEKAPLSEVAFPLDTEYEWDTISHNLKGRHTAGEVRAMWKLYLHPLLLQTKFDKTEYQVLLRLVRKYNYQNWDMIARDLGMRRSGYQCFVYYRSSIANSCKGTKWTPEEDEFLRQNVECYRSGDYIPWSTIAACFKDKNRLQVYNRYMNCVRSELKKGRFILEEDAVLLAAVEQFGTHFGKIAKFLPGRTPNQIRLRYNMSLSRSTSVVWSVEEDRKLMHLIGAMDPESVITFAAVARKFPNKDRASVRMRYLTLRNWYRAHPHSDLRFAPRRGPRFMARAKKVDLKTAVDNLVRRMESDAEDRPNPQVIRDQGLDDAIMRVYIKAVNEEQSHAPNTENESILKRRPRQEEPLQSAEEQKESQKVSDTFCLRTILLLLKANLDKKLFIKNPIGKRYLKLFEADPDATPVQLVRTYSRKADTNRPPPSASVADVWNNSRCFQPKYFLPANYQTITACKTLMVEAYHKNYSNRSLPLIRASPLKANYIKFLERCEILFTWPIYLSTVPPSMNLNSIYDDIFDPKQPDLKDDDSNTNEKNASEKPKNTGGDQMPVGKCSGLSMGVIRMSKKERLNEAKHKQIDLPKKLEALHKSGNSLIIKEMSGQITAIEEREDESGRTSPSELRMDAYCISTAKPDLPWNIVKRERTCTSEQVSKNVEKTLKMMTRSRERKQRGPKNRPVQPKTLHQNLSPPPTFSAPTKAYTRNLYKEKLKHNKVNIPKKFKSGLKSNINQTVKQKNAQKETPHNMKNLEVVQPMTCVNRKVYGSPRHKKTEIPKETAVVPGQYLSQKDGIVTSGTDTMDGPYSTFKFDRKVMQRMTEPINIDLPNEPEFDPVSDTRLRVNEVSGQILAIGEDDDMGRISPSQLQLDAYCFQPKNSLKKLEDNANAECNVNVKVPDNIINRTRRKTREKPTMENTCESKKGKKMKK